MKITILSTLLLSIAAGACKSPAKAGKASASEEEKAESADSEFDDDTSSDQGEETSDAAEASEKTADHNKELRVQRLFDALCLSSALGSKSRDVLKDISSTLQEAAEVDAAAEQRMEKSAAEYWKRTNLLFGLLAI